MCKISQRVHFYFDSKCQTKIFHSIMRETINRAKIRALIECSSSGMRNAKYFRLFDYSKN